MSHVHSLWPLSTELLRWSQRDPWTLAQAVEGTLISGATGSGKTSGPFQYVLRALLRCGCGGLFLCAKRDAADDYFRLADLEGRTGDVIFFSLNSRQAFNFLNYEAQRHGVGKAIVENIVQLLMEAQEVISRKPGHQQGEDFFEGAMKQLLRNCLEVVITATGEIDLTTVLQIVESLPQTSADVRMPEGLVALELLAEAERKAPERSLELALARSYFTKAWPRLADRTRSSIAQTLSVLLDAFVRYPIHDLLLSGTTCSPDDVLAGKVVILDVPVKEFEHIGKVVGVIWKYCLQRAIESRVKAGNNPDTLRPVFIAADEAQFWATKQDALFQQTARAARGVTVYASQSLANLYAELGGDPTGRAHVESLLGNLQTRIACQNSEPETNEWYARSIGRKKQYLTSWSFSPWAQLPKGKSKAEYIDYDVQPRKFTTLKSGGLANNYLVEAILICAGRQFRANGQRWLKVAFHQRRERIRWQWRHNGSVVRITVPRVTMPDPAAGE